MFRIFKRVFRTSQCSEYSSCSEQSIGTAQKFMLSGHSGIQDFPGIRVVWVFSIFRILKSRLFLFQCHCTGTHLYFRQTGTGTPAHQWNTSYKKGVAQQRYQLLDMKTTCPRQLTAET
jgi:hypothetical protein